LGDNLQLAPERPGDWPGPGKENITRQAHRHRPIQALRSLCTYCVSPAYSCIRTMTADSQPDRQPCSHHAVSHHLVMYEQCNHTCTYSVRNNRRNPASVGLAWHVDLLPAYPAFGLALCHVSCLLVWTAPSHPIACLFVYFPDSPADTKPTRLACGNLIPLVAFDEVMLPLTFIHLRPAPCTGTYTP
jgi:hypothetical protein